MPSVPEIAAAVLHLYRPRVGDPLHAVGAELWVGQKKVAAIEPVHTLGMSGSQVKTYLKQILQSFSQELGVELEDDDLGELLRQLMSLELDELIEEPEPIVRHQQAPSSTTEESVAGEVEKATLLEAFDSTDSGQKTGCQTFISV